MSDYSYRLTSRAKQTIKKVNDKSLLRRYQNTMREICKNPFEGEAKTGDLSGVYAVGFRYVDGEHRIAYTVIEEEGEAPIVLILLVGTRENFYAELKRIWRAH